MAAKEVVTKVWIEPGCIVCDACENAAPDVFEVLEDTCIIRPAALKPDFTKPRTQEIKDAAEECPVDVIKYDVVSEEVGDDEAAPSEEKQETATAAEEKKDEGKAAAEAPKKEKPKPEPAKASPDEAPAKKKTEPVTAGAGKTADPKTSMAGDPDPAITALLRAATARGGSAGILKKSQSVPESVSALRKTDPRDLPPDARQARLAEAARKMKEGPDGSRREFLGSASLVIGWVAFGVGTGVSIGPAFGRFMMPNVLEEPDPRIRVGKLQRYIEMSPGDVNEDYKPQGIWMIREEGRVAALNIICTHLGCIPNWLPNERKFKCPCHGSGYHPNGVNFEGPTPRPLERFRIFMDEGEIVVDKSRNFQYELGQWDQPGSYLDV